MICLHFYPGFNTSAWGETSNKEITIQIGTYNTLRKAATLRSILKEIGTIQVERIQSENKETLYRVLVGDFKTVEDANQFIKNYRLRDLFKDVWVNTIMIDTLNTQSIVSTDTLEKDPFFIQVNLACENGQHYGTLKTELHPDEKNSSRDVDLNVNWNCIANPTERWQAKDEKRSPTHLFIGALLGAGSLGMTDNTLGTTSRTDFSYGFQLGGFRSFGGTGPTFEYRLVNHRYNGSADTQSPQFFMAHRFLVGARLPVSHRLEFQPLLGFYTQSFLQGASDSVATLVDPLLSQVAIRTTLHLIELDQQAWFDLVASFHYLFPGTTPLFTLSSGYEYNLKIQTSSFFPDRLGINWFFEYSTKSLPSTTFTQNDTLFLLGITALIGF